MSRTSVPAEFGLARLKRDLQEEAANWYMLGFHLKIPYDQLKAIEPPGQKSSSIVCFAEMLNYWCKNNTKKDTWQAIFTALRDNSNLRLMRELQEKYQVNTKVVLTANELTGLLKDVAPNWYTFGISLDIHIPILKEIGGIRTSDHCFTDVLEKWLDSDDAYWETLVTALRQIGNRRLANKIQTDHIPDSGNPPLKMPNDAGLRSDEVNDTDTANGVNEPDGMTAPITVPLPAEYIKAYEQAIKNGGSLDYYLVHLMPFGPPKIGKTCFFHQLVHQKPPEGYARRKRGEINQDTGYCSTDVATERKAIEVTTRTINSDITSCNWEEWTFDQERSSIVRGVYEKSKTERDRNAPLEVGNVPLEEENNDIDNPAIRDITEGITQPSTRDQAHYKETMTIFYTDLGGQPEFQEVLPALFAGPTIFLPMLSLYDDLEKKYTVNYETQSFKSESYESQFTVIEMLKECFSSIISFKDAQEEYNRCPHLNLSDHLTSYPIKMCMIGTQKDLLTPGKEEEEIEKKDYVLRQTCTDTKLDDIVEYGRSMQKILIPVDNYDKRDGETVRGKIQHMIKRDDDSPFKLKIPVNWLGLELFLRKRKEPTISYDECKTIASRDLKIPKDSFKSCLFFLHHRTGTIRYFEDVEECKNTIITKPKVLFAAITKLITLSFQKGGSIEARTFKTYGLFKAEDVKSIVNDIELGMSFNQFTALLEHLNILSPAHGLKDNDGDKYDHFLPCALRHAENAPNLIQNNLIPLLVSFASGFVPSGVFGGLLGYFSKVGWVIKCVDKQPLLFRNQATFLLKKEKRTVIMRKNPEYLEFFIDQIKVADADHNACYNIYSVINGGIKNTCDKLGYSNSFKKISYGFNCTILERCKQAKHFAEVSYDQETRRYGRICSTTKERKELQDKMTWWFKPIHAGHEVTDEGIKKAKEEISIRLKQIPNHKGIAFLIGNLDPTVSGAYMDIHKMEAVALNDLKFAVHRMENPSPSEVACLAEAAAKYDYPESCKLIIFYFTGHGGIDTWGNCVIAPKGCKDTLPIKRILQPFDDRRNKIPCMFLLDCCLNRNIRKGRRNGEFSCFIPHHSIVAHATSENFQAQGGKNKGGLWTGLLCENLKNHLFNGTPLSEIVGNTQEDTNKKLREKKDSILEEIDLDSQREKLIEMSPKEFYEALKDEHQHILDNFKDQISKNWIYQEPFHMSNLNEVVYLDDIVNEP